MATAIEAQIKLNILLAASLQRIACYSSSTLKAGSLSSSCDEDLLEKKAPGFRERSAVSGQR